jgi:hypothetical protein
MRRASAAFILVVILCSLPRQAAAYTDPGSVNLILQVVAAGFAGVAFGFQKFIRRLFRRRKTTQPSDNHGD